MGERERVTGDWEREREMESNMRRGVRESERDRSFPISLMHL